MGTEKIRRSPSGPEIEVLVPPTVDPPDPAKYLSETGEYTIPGGGTVSGGDFIALNHFGEDIAINDPVPLELATQLGGLPSQSGTAITLDEDGLFALINVSGLYLIAVAAQGSGADGLSLNFGPTDITYLYSGQPPSTMIVPLPIGTEVSVRVLGGDGPWTSGGGNLLSNILTIHYLGSIPE